MEIMKKIKVQNGLIMINREGKEKWEEGMI